MRGRGLNSHDPTGPRMRFRPLQHSKSGDGAVTEHGGRADLDHAAGAGSEGEVRRVEGQGRGKLPALRQRPRPSLSPAPPMLPLACLSSLPPPSVQPRPSSHLLDSCCSGAEARGVEDCKAEAVMRPCVWGRMRRRRTRRWGACDGKGALWHSGDVGAGEGGRSGQSVRR